MKSDLDLILVFDNGEKKLSVRDECKTSWALFRLLR